MNPLAVALLPVLAFSLAVWWWRSWTGRARTGTLPAAAVWASAAVVVAYGVARNLPGLSWLAPG